MADIVGLLGSLSALLTLIGTYRFVNYFFDRGPELALLTSVSLTAVFLLIFEQIILLMGIAAIVSPIMALVYWYGVPKIPDSMKGMRDVKDGSAGKERSNNECPECGETNDTDNMFCDNCGYRIES